MNCSIKSHILIILLLISIAGINSCKKSSLPTVTTGSVSRILQSSAYAGGQVTSDGGAQITMRGVCWNTSGDPTLSDSKTSDSTGIGIFVSHITGLTASTLYYVKAYATNSEGTAFGSEVSFTTDPVALPSVATSGVKALTLTTAYGGGDITNDGGLPLTERGVCWNTSGIPTIADSHSSDGTGTGLFVSTLTDMTLNTSYRIRAFATNSLGTAYGDEVLYTHLEPVLDNDGNAYSKVTIGTQIWLGENLRTTTYNDGSAIPQVTGGNEWAIASTPAYCWYNNSEAESKIPYGALYNWYAVNTGKLCPTGWHVPTADEYLILLTYLGGDQAAGGKLKEVGTSHWLTPNLGASNTSGFTALPGGGRYSVYSQGGTYADLGLFGYHWSASPTSSTYNAFSFDMGFDRSSVRKSEYSRTDGGSVRCLQNSK